MQPQPHKDVVSPSKHLKTHQPTAARATQAPQGTRATQVARCEEAEECMSELPCLCEGEVKPQHPHVRVVV